MLLALLLSIAANNEFQTGCYWVVDITEPTVVRQPEFDSVSVRYKHIERKTAVTELQALVIADEAKKTPGRDAFVGRVCKPGTNKGD